MAAAEKRPTVTVTALRRNGFASQHRAAQNGGSSAAVHGAGAGSAPAGRPRFVFTTYRLRMSSRSINLIWLLSRPSKHGGIETLEPCC
jgi:hypothetical protein